ncbi:MAG: HD domain-containing protein, partial [Clostridia bacterium]|nr:HD domain-containing protein [Clostridia bacterium]
IKPLGSLKDCLDAVRHHHEKLDGSGYPDGLKAEDISMEARILAVADIFDALYSKRPYRDKLPIEKCKAILLEEAGKGQLDKSIIDVLFSLIDDGSIDSIAE